MPILQQPEIQEIVLPSSTETDKAIACIKQLTVGDVVGLNLTDEDEIDAQANIWKLLELSIVSWNFTEADGSQTPVTVENIKRLSIADFSEIVKALNLNKLTEGEKKAVDSAPVRPEEQSSSN